MYSWLIKAIPGILSGIVTGGFGICYLHIKNKNEIQQINLKSKKTIEENNKSNKSKFKELDSKIKKLEYNNSKKLQVDNFYRKVSMEKINELMSYFYNSLSVVGTNKKLPSEEAYNLTHNLALYCSDTSCIIFSLYLKLERIIEKNNKKEEEMKKKAKNHSIDCNCTDHTDIFRAQMYLAFIISSIKVDFSDINVSPLTIVKIALNNYDDDEQYFLDAFKEVNEDLSAYNIQRFKNIYKD